jgi:hypothetical protein
MSTLGQTVRMRERIKICTVNTGTSALALRFRRALAALMTLVVFATSFAVATREPARAMPSVGRAVVAMTTSGKYRPKPCQKIVLPGTVNTCPLAGFSFNFIPAVAADYAVATMITAAQWRLSHSSLVAQCSGFSPYRPPCSQV